MITILGWYAFVGMAILALGLGVCLMIDWVFDTHFGRRNARKFIEFFDEDY
jgi:hypothetical protein